ncbi:MAG: hypothetical protein ACD_54C00414G0002 [uncultured bacterium]|nr:MAG: hypothetical protein ACD_54C00414G0002 [uncultured bacterium]
MTLLFDPARFTNLIWQLNTALSWLLILLPATIALAGYASLAQRSDDRIRAWVQVITGSLLALWLLAPWQPTDPAIRAANATITLFTYGYVLQDWLRELWRSSGLPRWAHWLVFVTFLATLLCAAVMGYQIYLLDRP